MLAGRLRRARNKMNNMINNKVYIDYRDNLFVDGDNSILAFKANRDRYVRNGKQDAYAGLAHIGSKNSEDAITWNYFRSLEIHDNYSSLEKLMSVGIEKPEILLWTLAFNEKSKELQYTCGSIIRKIDGVFLGQITEPDVIIKTKNSFIVIECKLGEINKYPNHLWGSEKRSNGPVNRKNSYFEDDLFCGDKGYDSYSYQLYRMAYYTFKIAKHYKLRPIFVSLVNRSWWEIKKGDKQSPKGIWLEFIDQINKGKLECNNYFWQDICETGQLGDYLSNHECLKKIS